MDGGAAGVADRPALGSAGLRDDDDDVVACVVWRRGRVLATWVPGHRGGGRVAAWISRAIGRVSAEAPLARLTARELASSA